MHSVKNSNKLKLNSVIEQSQRTFKKKSIVRDRNITYVMVSYVVQKQATLLNFSSKNKNIGDLNI